MSEKGVQLGRQTQESLYRAIDEATKEATQLANIVQRSQALRDLAEAWAVTNRPARTS